MSAETASDQAPEEAPQGLDNAPPPSLEDESASVAEEDDEDSTYLVSLEMFEGPLDLLLHLVRRHELDILDIPISFVTEKYLAYLEFMRAMDLEIAGDYLVMAATLAYLKSRELLPPDPTEEVDEEGEEEEGEDPREALIRRLLEYERFKAAAFELDSMPVSGRDVFSRGVDIEPPDIDPGLAPVTLFKLAEAYNRVLNRARIQQSHDVELEPITVAQRMEQLTLMLREKPVFEFEELFLRRTWSSEHELRSMLVVTLMSLLEMVKMGIAQIEQPAEGANIRVCRRAATEQALQMLNGYDEDASFGDVPSGPVGPNVDDTPSDDEDSRDAVDDGREDGDEEAQEAQEAASLGFATDDGDEEALEDASLGFAADGGDEEVASPGSEVQAAPPGISAEARGYGDDDAREVSGEESTQAAGVAADDREDGDEDALAALFVAEERREVGDDGAVAPRPVEGGDEDAVKAAPPERADDIDEDRELAADAVEDLLLPELAGAERDVGADENTLVEAAGDLSVEEAVVEGAIVEPRADAGEDDAALADRGTADDARTEHMLTGATSEPETDPPAAPADAQEEAAAPPLSESDILE